MAIIQKNPVYKEYHLGVTGLIRLCMLLNTFKSIRSSSEWLTSIGR